MSLEQLVDFLKTTLSFKPFARRDNWSYNLLHNVNYSTCLGYSKESYDVTKQKLIDLGILYKNGAISRRVYNKHEYYGFGDNFTTSEDRTIYLTSIVNKALTKGTSCK